MTVTDHALVTGGAGFLGSHLVDSLLDDGHRVTVLDNFGSGRPENLAHQGTDRLDVYDFDIQEPFPELNTDVVYHFASRASPEDFDSHPVEIALINGVGTRNVFDHALATDAQVVLASTSEVYGNPEVHPQHEEYNGNVNVRGPRAPYDESKRYAEALTVAYEAQYNIDVRTLRIFNTYVPRMRPDDGRVIPNFLTQALAGDDLTVYGDGSQTRSFCYVDDLIAGVRAVADAAADDAAGEAFNLASDREVTIRALAELVVNVVGSDSGITYGPLPEDDPEVRQPYLSKIKQAIGWMPTVGLETGLRQTLEAFRRDTEA